jgi:hypothetical protein
MSMNDPFSDATATAEPPPDVQPQPAALSQILSQPQPQQQQAPVPTPSGIQDETGAEIAPPSPYDTSDLLAVHDGIQKGRSNRARNTLLDALSTFIYSTGQGMLASAQYPGQRGANAAFGAALQGGQQLQEQRQQQAFQQAQMQLAQAKAKTDQQNADTMTAYRNAQDVNIAPTEVTNPFDGTKETVPANQVGKYYTEMAKRQQEKDKAAGALDLSYLGRGMGRQDPTKPYDETSNPYMPLPDGDPRLTPDVIQKRLETAAKTQLITSQKALADAQAAFTAAKNDPTSPIFKQAQQALDNAARGHDVAMARVAQFDKTFEAEYQGTIGGQAIPGGPVDDAGNPIGLKIAKLAQGMGGQAPAQLKMQTAAALTTKDMIATVRNLVAQKPYLIGPAAGRAAEAYQGIGTSFGMASPQDETDAATLAGHMGYLFANELRASFPNRPPQQIIEMLKEKSAQMKQDPSIMEGFLKSAENNANVALKTGAKFGIPEAKAAIGVPATSPVTPAVTNNTPALAVSLAQAKVGDVVNVPKSVKVPSGKVRKTKDGFEAVP